MRFPSVVSATVLAAGLFLHADARATEPNGSVVTAAGHGLLYGTLSFPAQYSEGVGYVLIDNTRGGGNSVSDAEFNTVYLSWYFERQQFPRATPVFGDGTRADKASIAVDAYYALAASWDYFLNRHGRRGVGNRPDAAPDKLFVDVDFQNVGWEGHAAAGSDMSNSFVMVGVGAPEAGINPFTTLDIVGREFARAIVEASAEALAFEAEPSGVQNSIADVFGAMIEFDAAHPNDPGDYVIGELAVLGGMREMYKQDFDGRSYVCYPRGGFPADADGNSQFDGNHVSGIGNRAFYLVAEGARSLPGVSARDLVCNGDTRIVGIGRDKAAKIWYRAMTTALTETTTYADLRRATMRAAEQLYGVGSRECQAVARAWAAVNVR